MPDQNSVVDAIIARIFAEACTQSRIAGERIGLERKLNEMRLEMRLEAAAEKVATIELELQRVQVVAGQMVEAGKAQKRELSASMNQNVELRRLLEDMLADLESGLTVDAANRRSTFDELCASNVSDEDFPDLEDLASTIARREAPDGE